MYFETYKCPASLKSFALIAMSSALMACGGNSGGSSDVSKAATDTVEETTQSPEIKQLSIQGGAIKGVIENGIVRIFAIDSEAGFYRKSDTPLGDAERTDKNGQFNLSISADALDAVVVEITADADTRMTCDVIEGCGTDEQGSAIAFGEVFPLNHDFILEAAYSGLSDKQALTLYVTPLTHLAVSYAAAQPDGLSAVNIDASYALIEETLNLSFGSLQLPPPDLTQLDAYDSLSGDELQYAVISASFLALVNEPDWGSIDEVINAAAERFAGSGSLPESNGGALTEVTLDDLFYEASGIAAGLQHTTDNASIIVELVSVESSTELYYQEASNLFSDDQEGVDNLPAEGAPNASEGEQIIVDTEPAESPLGQDSPSLGAGAQEPVDNSPVQSLTILSHPGSLTSAVNSPVELSVTAQGEGAITYQWRKDGVEIDGATDRLFSIDDVQLADSGVYDVLVSNGSGRVPSMAATLSVETLALTAQLSWNVPAKRQDGSDLLVNEISGYKVVYGTEPDSLSSQVMVDDAQTTDYVFSDLQAATTYYFKIATIDANGVQGEYSAVVEKQFM